MVRSLDRDDVRAKVGSQEKAERLDGVGPLGLASGEAELSELLVWLQHDHVGAKNHPSLLLLVVVYLHGCVVWDSECDDLSLVPLCGRRSACFRAHTQGK